MTTLLEQKIKDKEAQYVTALCELKSELMKEVDRLAQLLPPSSQIKHRLVDLINLGDELQSLYKTRGKVNGLKGFVDELIPSGVDVTQDILFDSLNLESVQRKLTAIYKDYQHVESKTENKNNLCIDVY